MAEASLSVGYDEDFVSPVDEDFTCSICRVALREPVLTRCGHRFCRQCLQQCFTRQNGLYRSCPCPIDREELTYEKDVFPDKATERKVLSLAIKCKDCKWTGELRNKQEHFKECQVECPSGCGAIMQREKLSHHTGRECPLAMIQCPYYPMGCVVKVKRGHLDSHLDCAVRRHLDLACLKLHANQEEFKDTTRKLENKIEALQKELKEKVDAQAQLTKNLGIKLEGEVTKLKGESTPFMWKIEGFKEILRDAKRGRDTHIWSGYFYTGPIGYKLRVCMCPNGDGGGKNTHVSVYLYIHRGKYDAVLPWPFQKTTIFTLIDQQENPLDRVNCVNKISPYRDFDLLGRPMKESNSGCGFHTFISHQELRRRRYIVDDTLFLQVQTFPPP